MSKHHTVLGVVPKCGVDFLKARWRVLASQNHPDRGGNPVDFSTFRNAYQAALKIEMAEEAKCKECDGVGKVPTGTGFNKVMMTCQKCRGKGLK